MQTVLRAAWAALFATLPFIAEAQEPVTAVALGDANPAVWDASGHLAWLTVDKTPITPEWNRWYDVATVGASVGRFFGPHLKAEADVATSSSADVYVQRQVVVPNQPYPVYVSQPQRFQTTTVSLGAAYQFFDNRWFHPMVGAGVESMRERRTVEQVLYPLPPPSVIVETPGTSIVWRSRPYGSLGFKWFVSEHAFVRSDVRTTFNRGGVSHVSWRTGIGFDF